MGSSLHNSALFLLFKDTSFRSVSQKKCERLLQDRHHFCNTTWILTPIIASNSDAIHSPPQQGHRHSLYQERVPVVTIVQFLGDLPDCLVVLPVHLASKKHQTDQ